MGLVEYPCIVRIHRPWDPRAGACPFLTRLLPNSLEGTYPEKYNRWWWVKKTFWWHLLYWEKACKFWLISSPLLVNMKCRWYSLLYVSKKKTNNISWLCRWKSKAFNEEKKTFIKFVWFMLVLMEMVGSFLYHSSVTLEWSSQNAEVIF